MGLVARRDMMSRLPQVMSSISICRSWAAAISARAAHGNEPRRRAAVVLTTSTENRSMTRPGQRRDLVSPSRTSSANWSPLRGRFSTWRRRGRGVTPSRDIDLQKRIPVLGFRVKATCSKSFLAQSGRAKSGGGVGRRGYGQNESFIRGRAGDYSGAAATGCEYRYVRARHGQFRLTDLRLVAPREGWPPPEERRETMIAASAGAAHLIENAKLFATVEEAVADLQFVWRRRRASAGS